MMIGAPFVPIALFIFGWTAPPYVAPGGGSWVGPCAAGIPFGFGMVTIYFAANAYLIDAFPGYVASALAAKTVVRSGAGAAMPLFVTQMFVGMGNGPAASVLAGVALAMVSRVWKTRVCVENLMGFLDRCPSRSCSTSMATRSARGRSALWRDG
jgi:hypothetical protein